MPLYRTCIFLVLLVLLWFNSQAFASDHVLVAADNSNSSHQKLLLKLRDTLNSLPGQSVRISVVKPEKLATTLSSAGTLPRLLITVGTRAANTASELQPPFPPVLHALLPRTTYAHLEEKWREKDAFDHVFALFLDQPFSRRLRLLELALPQKKHMAVLLGPWSAPLEQELRDSAAEHWKLRTATITRGEKVIQGLREVLNGSDILFAIADPEVYNRRTAQGILLTTYRHRIPVLGFSRNHVKSGALLAVYSTPAQIGRQVAELAHRLLVSDTTTLPRTVFPKYFNLAINRQVARSLGISLKDKEKLLHLLRNASSSSRSLP